ncbi:MAG: hypothetical protein KBH21_05720 [Acetoanaerobium sp.]|nr:hypothetical protein [Acetoanaerobium sp.]
MSWTLSCLSLKDSLGTIELYANKKGIDVLADLIGLPYDKLHEFPQTWKLPSSDLWALPKVYTYSLQKEPFIHIDGDVYIFEKFPEAITNASVVAQNIELFTDYYYSVMPLIKQHFNYIPQYVTNDFSSMCNLKALNAGILGGNDLVFFEKFTDEVYRYINLNLSCLSAIDVSRFNVFFEQHLCYNMSNIFNKKIEYLLEPMYCDNGYNDLAQFHKIASGECPYIHLLGNYKRDLFTCQQMEKTLMCLYPNYYERILKIMQDTMRLVCCNNYSQMDVARLGDKIQILNYLKQSVCNNFSQERDLKEWLSKINKSICMYSDISDDVLEERDRESFLWHAIIFDTKGVRPIKRSLGLQVLHSNYNWARLFRGFESTGNAYYDISLEQLDLGDYYSLFVKEQSTYLFSVFDIDQLEYTILKELKRAISLEELYKSMFKYVEHDILENHTEQYQKLLEQYIERLVQIKAIKPEM